MVKLPEAAAKQGMDPLAYMRKYGCFEVLATNYVPYEAEVTSPPGASETPDGRLVMYTVEDAKLTAMVSGTGDETMMMVTQAK